jgi:hypothetical protein
MASHHSMPMNQQVYPAHEFISPGLVSSPVTPGIEVVVPYTYELQAHEPNNVPITYLSHYCHDLSVTICGFWIDDRIYWTL